MVFVEFYWDKGRGTYIMALWLNKPNTYKHPGFINIPEGDHRARICNVEVERFSKKKKCFKILTKCAIYDILLL